ncbi:unnamed protein product [Paramecium octaurelia]|uniref:Uncharacterized protein n=1 Tax=Paramecium octaurelia TaxID=43137 RepID=A0A8S1TDI7_PAROT|nr:unnamed protein product [Paramecium octaurelia]
MDNNFIELQPLLYTNTESRTPSVSRVCVSHKKEIIMIDMDSQKKKIEDRFVCVNCISDNPQIKYQTIEDVNKQWIDYNLQSEDRLQQYQKEIRCKRYDLSNQIAQMRKNYNQKLNEISDKLIQEQFFSIIKKKLQLNREDFIISFRGRTIYQQNQDNQFIRINLIRQKILMLNTLIQLNYLFILNLSTILNTYKNTFDNKSKQFKKYCDLKKLEADLIKLTEMYNNLEIEKINLLNQMTQQLDKNQQEYQIVLQQKQDQSIFNFILKIKMKLMSQLSNYNQQKKKLKYQRIIGLKRIGGFIFEKQHKEEILKIESHKNNEIEAQNRKFYKKENEFQGLKSQIDQIKEEQLELEKVLQSFNQSNSRHNNTQKHYYFQILIRVQSANQQKGEKLLKVVVVIVFVNKQFQKMGEQFLHSNYVVDHVLLLELDLEISQQRLIKIQGLGASIKLNEEQIVFNTCKWQSLLSPQQRYK